MGFMNLQLAREKLQSAELDALLVLSPRHFYYATGHNSWYLNLYAEAGYGAAIVATNPTVGAGALVSDIEEEPLRQSAPEFAQILTYPVWIAYADVPSLAEGDGLPHLTAHSQGQPLTRTGQVDFDLAVTRLIDLVRQMGLHRARIGLEWDFTSGPVLNQLQTRLPQCQWVNVGDLIEQLRAIKSPLEADLLRRGTQLAEAGITDVQDAIIPGMTAQEIAHCYRASVFARAKEVAGPGEVVSARITLRVGPHVLSPQSSSTYAVQAGDLIFMDCGVEISGYWADMGRAFVLGQATPVQRQIYQALRTGFIAATELLHVGNTPGQVFAAGLAAVHAAGMTAYVRGNLGHGVGLHRAPELPIISREEVLTLAPGQVISVEFPYYIQGIGAFQLEDTFYLRANGRECFNRLSHDLAEIG